MEESVGTVAINENFTHEGVVILRCRIKLFYSCASEGMDSFYDTLAKSSYEYVNTKILDMARRQYAQSEDKKKRLRFQPFVYKLSGEITLDCDKLFSQKIEASLTHGGEAFCSFCDGHVWQKNGSILLSKRRALKEHGIAIPKESFDSALLCENGALVLKGGAWHKI